MTHSLFRRLPWNSRDEEEDICCFLILNVLIIFMLNFKQEFLQLLGVVFLLLFLNLKNEKVRKWWLWGDSKAKCGSDERIFSHHVETESRSGSPEAKGDSE